MKGPGVPVPLFYQAYASDAVGDGDVDLLDWMRFTARMTCGPATGYSVPREPGGVHVGLTVDGRVYSLQKMNITGPWAIDVEGVMVAPTYWRKELWNAVQNRPTATDEG